MKKAQFFSLHHDAGALKSYAVLHSGYSDGYYYYYRVGASWCAVEPSTGLAVAWAPTRKESALKAWAAWLPAKGFTAERFQEWRDNFNAAVSEILSDAAK